jgi:hypothetical protein
MYQTTLGITGESHDLRITMRLWQFCRGVHHSFKSGDFVRSVTLG